MANNDSNSNSRDQKSHRSKMPNLVKKPKSDENRIKNVIVNSRKIGTKHRIQLTKSENGGFGFKIAERDNMFGRNRPIYITAITTTGSAYRDGRLKEGDMLLEVNDVDLSGKSQPEVTRMLKSVGINESVEFVVSRQEDPPVVNNDYVNIELDHDQIEKRIDSIFNVPCKDGPGTYVYDIPLNQTKSAGLGLYLKYPTQEGKDLGIWIEKVITGGAAWKDGRLQPDDQILAVNGINLLKMSNTEATDTLMAAVSRGLGPEATSDTIRLSINRRDPLVVSRILHGTNNRTRYSDNHSNKTDRIRSPSKADSNKSPSNQNSQNNPVRVQNQTQASTNFTVPLNPTSDKSNQSNSDQTNEATSAMFQNTEFTNIDLNISDNQKVFTLPKTNDAVEENQILDPSGRQSWDDESIENVNGEERFQRDGFGRQSISEKRHAQLMAKDTDTFKRNQKLKEERERQRQLEEQMAGHCLNDNNSRMSSSNVNDQTHNQRIPNSHTIHDNNPTHNNQNYISTIQSSHDGIRQDTINYGTHREVPVDVQVPSSQPNFKLEYSYNNINPGNNQSFIEDYNSRSHPTLNQHVTTAPLAKPCEGIYNQAAQRQINSCNKCGLAGRSCLCRATSLVRPQLHQGGYDNPALKRSTSMESIQLQQMMPDSTIAPRLGTARIARNRKINESFRAAVDRSYEVSTTYEPKNLNNGLVLRSKHTSAKMSNSITNSTTSTSNDERFSMGETHGKNVTAHKKSSSLLTRLFSSMRRKKKSSKDEQHHIPNSKSFDEKTLKDSSSNRDSRETNRSQMPKYSHNRIPQSQSYHRISNDQQAQQSSRNNFESTEQQLYGQTVKSQTLQKSRQVQIGAQTPHRTSMNLYQYQPVTSSQGHPGGQYKFEPNYSVRATTNFLNNQYPLVRGQQQLQQALPFEQLQQQQQQHLLVDTLNNQLQYQPIVSHSNIIQNPGVSFPNGYQHPPPQVWQPPIQTPNGLWVANSPVSNNIEQYQNNKIYGSHSQHVEPQFHNHQQQPSVNFAHHQNPIVSHPPPPPPPINGHLNSNGVIHQSPILHNHISTMTQQQHLHNQQPQHIYYYDF